MKKTSFTFARIWSRGFRRQPLMNPLMAVFTTVMLFVGNFAFGQIMDPCPAGSGNSVINCPAVGPHIVFANANCQAPVPDYKPGVGGNAGAGYIFVGVVQVPMAGDLIGLGNTTVQVGAAFLDQTGGPNNGMLCADVCPNITVTVQDNTPPIAVCVAGPVVMSADATCNVTFTQANIEANFYVFPPTDNCGPITYSANPATLPGPVCGAGNPTLLTNVVITATDGAGNMSACVVPTQVQDNTPPTVAVCPGNQIVNVTPAIGVCQGMIGNYMGLVSGISDNCDPGPVFQIMQSPAPGATFNIPTGCGTFDQPTAVTVQDCFGNTTVCAFIVTFVDNTPPTITSACPAPINLVTNGNCEITIPNLTGGMTAQDNCAMPANITFSQNPPVGLLNVSGLCPPNNTVTVTLTATDCNNNSSDQVCTALITFTDMTPPVITCPATPIPVIVPFNSLTCEHGTATLTLADILAAGVTIMDACDPNPQITSIDPNMFMCPDIGKAGLTVTINGQDCFGNPASQACAVQVLAPDNLTAAWSIPGGDFIVCPSEFPLNIILGPNTPSCGVWSGDVAVTATGSGNVTYSLDAASFPDLDNDGLPDPGAYSLTYTVGAPGCHVSETHNIQIAPTFVAGDANLVADFSICWEATETFDLEGLLAPGSIQGGLYTILLGGGATGQQIGNLFQYLGGDGTLTVTYQLTDCDGNIISDQVVISIDEKPAGYFSLPANFCQDEGATGPIITGVPAGATISFASIPAGFITNPLTGSFDPAAGPLAGEFANVFVTMTVTNGVCAPFNISQWIVVYASGNPAFTIPATICESAPPLVLLLDNPLNDGGVNPLIASNVTWTGTSVTDFGTSGAFDPSVGPGVYTICVTVGAPSCEEILCQDITVEPDYTVADVALVADFTLCLLPDDVIDFSSLLAATALPGGTFTVVEAGDLNGNGIVNANGYVYKGECGTLTITHFFPDDCVPNDDVIVITIEQRPDVGGLAIPGPLCAQDGPAFIEYSGTPVVCGVAGVFTAPNSPAGTLIDLGTGTTAVFSPVAAGEGLHLIQYEIGNPITGCHNVVFGWIEVRASSDPDFTIPSTSCANEVIALALDNADPSVLPTSPDGITEIVWFGGDGLNGIVTDNGDGTGTFVGYVAGTYTICVQTGDLGCNQYRCHQITVDNVPPVMSCGPLVRTRSNDLGLCTYDGQGTEFDVTATDNCIPPNGASSLILTHNYAPHVGTDPNSLDGATFPVGITQVMWTATDTAGNSANCTIEIVINDTEGPTVQSCPTSFSQGTDADICGAGVTYGIPQFADNCDGIDLEGVLISGYAPGTDFPVGVTTVTWTYTDLADNSTATCSFTVTISDDDAPVAICSPAYAVSLDGDGEFDVLATDIDNASYDNCTVVSTLISRTGGAPFSGSVTMTCADVTSSPITVTLQVTDQAGLTSTCTTQVTVNDDQVPDIECPGNYTVVADPATCDAVVTYPAPTVTDNCSTTVTQLTTYGGPADASQEVPANNSPASGTVSATLDNDNNLHLAVWFSNLTAPTVAAHIHNAAAGANGPVIVNLAPLGFPIGQAGGGFNATFALDATQAAEFLAGNLYVNIHTSNVPSGEIRGQLVTQGLTSGDAFPVGTTVQTYEVVDIAGNIETCSFTITVYDEVAPTVDCGPTVRTRSADPGMCSFTMPGAGFDAVGMDNCGDVTLTHNYPFAVNPNTLAGSSFPVGSTTVTWIATDASDNQSAICGIEIIVTDDENPTINCGVSGGSANALVNGSFEAGGPFNTQGADGWLQFGPAFRLFASVDPNSFFTHDGNVMMKLFDNNSGLFQDVPVTPGDQLSGSLWIRNAGFDPISVGREGFLKFEFFDAANNLVGAPLESTKLGSTLPIDVWTEVTLNAVVPAGATKVRFVVAQTAPGGPGAVMFDDASLNIVTPVTNILANSSFEAGNPNNDSPGAQTDNWSAFGAVFRLNQPPGQAADGIFFLKTFGGASGVFQDFPVTLGDELNGSAFLQNASIDPTGPGQFGLVKFEFLDGNGVKLSEVEGPQFFAGDLPTNVWTEATVNAVVPAGTVTARFVVVSVSPGGGAVMMDKASVIIGSLPVIGDVTVSNDPGACGANITIDNPMASDNCGIVSIINDYNHTTNASDFYPVGTTIVTFTVTDASGNTAECSISVTVEDNEAPVFSNCPTTMVMIGNDPDQCSGKLNWSIPVATDNCGIQSVTQTGGPANGSVIPVGAPQTVTYTATDIHGNTTACTFEVQVVDTQKPQFDADIVMPTDITVECDAVPTNCVFKGNGICSPLTNDDVNDNCTPSSQLVITFTEVSTKDPNPNNCAHYNYTLTRTWTVTDQAGNQLVHVQVITVQDTTPPVPVCQNATITLDKFGNASINPSTLIAGTTDNCAPFSALTVTANQTNFTCANLGPNNVTLTISDPCGNTATCTIVVTVEEGLGSCTPQGFLASSCLNNATTLTNGQFAELIRIKALAGQTWTITTSNGLFTAGSPNPPAAPIAVPNGTALTMGLGDSMVYYTLNARYVEAIGYTATATNNLGQTVTLSNIGHYPTPILTDFYPPFCLSTPAFVPQVVDQFAGAGAYTSVTFLVNGQPATQIDPAALGLGQHTLTIIADAGDAAFSRRVNGVLVTGDAANSAEAQLNPGCIQTITVFFQIVTTPTQVVCNDLVNVTLEPGCVSVITPDMVLEGTYACFDDYEVHIYLPNGVPLNPFNVLTGAHVGQNLQYVLHHPISGNACWGSINLEDKTPPTATCPDPAEIWCTVDPDSIVFYLPPNHPRFPARDFFGKLVPAGGSLLYLGQPTATDCSSWTWEYTDDYIVNDCAANASVAIDILRTFVITDAHENQTTCTQVITKFRGEASHVNIPADTTFACNNPILNTIAPAFHPSVIGWPQISGINITPAGTGICGLGVTYTDEIVNLCTESYKVVRTWKIFDWCPAGGGAPTTTTFTQYIKVENLAPVITVNCQQVNNQGFCILNANSIGNAPHTLCGALNVPLAQVDGVCDNVTQITVETPAGFTTNGGIIPSPGLPLGGPYDLVYRAEDECGNITQFVLTVVVEDKTAPVAICDEITDVNLTSDGLAVVYAETFDDGSYDNCCVDRFEVRRMTPGCGTGTSFGPSVTFCCADIANSPVTVVFRVVDCNGNTNECMVTVQVSDKLVPILLTCPSNQRVTCDWYADNVETQLAGLAGNAAAQSQLLDQYFGTPTFFDNCELTINRNININIDQCLEGTITRSWTAVDPSNNQSTPCTQTVFVDHVSDWVVEFPADITVNCGTDVPDFGEPEIFFETCELVGVSYLDEVFTVVPDACYKILRTWTVINWCVVGAEIDQEVVESSERAFQLAGILPFPACDFDGDGDCDTRTFRDSWRVSPLAMPGAADATTQFGPDTDPDSDPWDGYITYQQVIKVNDTVDPVFTNGCTIPDVCIEDNTCSAVVVFPTPEITECSPSVTFNVTSSLGTGFGPFSNVAPGTYNVTYNVMDNCNNQTNCTTTVTVKDCKKPTPYCKNGLVIELMQTGMVELWAVDFNAGSFDNCTPQSELTFSFSANVNETARTYTCDDIGQQIVQMWVTDLAGNQDFCETFVIVQDNMNACDPGGNPLISGSIQTEANQSVANVNVQLSGTSQASMMTGNDGMFNFTVVPGGDYTVVPVKDIDPLNGVTTFDLVLITKHILGSQLLDSPYKIIAADANKSNTVTTFDLVQLRKLILFIDTDFPNNTSWRFVSKSYVFPNPANPWSQTFPEVININNIAANQLAADFVAVKIGDVNGSAQPNLTADPEDRNAVGSLVFAIDEALLAAGQQYTVDFKARDFDVLGYQFTLNFDRTALEFVQVNSSVASTENFGLTMLDKGAITTSWNDNDVRLSDDEVVFSLVFKAIATVKLSEALSVNSRYTAAEAYKRNGELLDVELVFNGSQVAGNFELYQNTPNPFTSSTVVGFNLPEASTATLKITDVSGRIVKMVKGDYVKGYNEVRLQRSELPSTGILYYQLDTQSDSATKMMLLMD